MKIYNLGKRETVCKKFLRGCVEWLKKFFKGAYIACWMIIVVGVAFMAVRLGVWVLIIGAAIGSRIEPTTNNIIIMLCTFFVVMFGLIWSTWS